MAPRFWQGSRWHPAAVVLSPIGALYAAGTARRLRRAPGYRADVPVICVGNLHAGGTGKTPTVIALAERLAARGQRPAIVSRGHGGRLTGPVRVSETGHTAADVGDEPLLLAAFAPVWVARDRAAGARAAAASGADCLILDDGFQNPAVAKSLSIVVVDAAHGFGNGRCLPAGPLREPVAPGLARADACLTIGNPNAQQDFTAAWGARLSVPRWTGRLQPLETGMDWSGLSALAFAGIGHPQKFFDTLRGLGARLAGAHALADHQPLSPALLARLSRQANAANAQLVTTEKDAARLPPQWRGKILALPVRLRLDDAAPLDRQLDRLGL